MSKPFFRIKRKRLYWTDHSGDKPKERTLQFVFFKYRLDYMPEPMSFEFSTLSECTDVAAAKFRQCIAEMGKRPVVMELPVRPWLATRLVNIDSDIIGDPRWNPQPTTT